MKIGKYKLFSLETSEFSLDGGAMYGIIPKILWEKQTKSDDLNRIKMVTRSLLLVSESKKILIDTGNGTKWSEKLKDRYNIDNTKLYNYFLNLDLYVDKISEIVFNIYDKFKILNIDITSFDTNTNQYIHNNLYIPQKVIHETFITCLSIETISFLHEYNIGSLLHL